METQNYPFRVFALDYNDMNISLSETRRSLPDGSNSSIRVIARPSTLQRQDAAAPPAPVVASKPTRALHSSFAPRPLTLNGANAPLMPKVTAPFAGNERKRAFTSAMFYSECFLHGIVPVDADIAATDAQSQFEKWWIHTKYKKTSESSPNKRRKVDVSCSEYDNNNNDVKDGNQAASDVSCISGRTFGSSSSSTSDLESLSIREIGLSARYTAKEVAAYKDSMISELTTNGGDTTTPAFLSYLEVLNTSYASRGWDARWGPCASSSKSSPFEMDGTWLNLSKPTFSECLGRNDRGEYMYTLGRLAFDMFRPTHLKCTIQGIFNSISLRKNKSSDRPAIICPTPLQQEMIERAKRKSVRNYDIIVALTINPDQDKKGNPVDDNADPKTFVVKRPIRALLTNRGYCVPDPVSPNRLTVWFTGGTLEILDQEADLPEWKELFDPNSAPSRSLSEYARVLAARILLGAKVSDEMKSDGSINYELERPIGGHGQVFVDVLYADDTTRIVKGHHGSIFVFTRVPNPE